MKTYLDIDEIQIGSWWARADSIEHGYCVLDIDDNEDVHVIDTNGNLYKIDYIKLQYRYYQVTPNKIK